MPSHPSLALAVAEVARKLESNVRELVAWASRAARELADRGLVELLSCEDRRDASWAGVDGWYGLVGRVGLTPVYYYRAVAVAGGALAGSRDGIVYSPGSPEDEVHELASLAALMAEAVLARELEGVEVVVVDGPLADPPHEPRGALARSRLPRYHARRAGLLRDLVRRGVLLLGYAKRLSGRALASVLGALPAQLGDAELATAVLGTALREARSSCFAVLGPLPLASPAAEHYAALRPAVYYVMARWWASARRLEVPRGQADDALALLPSLVPRGLEHPAPVLLAHRLAAPSPAEIEAARMILARVTSHLLPG